MIISLFAFNVNGQTINIDGNAGSRQFDGIGAVSGGGATSVLLKDYPEPQRSQILDLLFKPNFGASISALLVEVPGDGNSTQGSEPSHMHSRTDLNYSRGYEWWLMSEAKKRNPSLSLDANAWSCPQWVGNKNFWSQDMCDYYAKWIKGLKDVHKLDLDALGCRNEKGVNEDFVKMLRTTLNSNGFSKVKIHAFDNWGDGKFSWCADMKTDVALRNAVDIMGAHTMSEIPAPASIQQLSVDLGKPIWNTEEHIYYDGFDCELKLVQSFNNNYIKSGVTKIVNWYLIGSTYSIEPYSEQPAMMIAHEPWSGNYYTREVLWGYAHYGQFSAIGWQYLNGACGNLSGGGSYVTMKSPGTDFSIIAETKDAKSNQQVTFNVSGGLSNSNLCVWLSNATAQFVKLADITPINGSFTYTFEPNSIYSISTTTGQQKGKFANVPDSKSFPFPYYETFDEYTAPARFGYLPNYTADIAGVFEIADRTDGKGKCMRQVVSSAAQSWAPEWTPYTIIGNANWENYEASVDVYLENTGWAGLMGRVSFTGGGYGCKANGYYMSLSSSGDCALYVASQDTSESKMGTLLASGKVANVNLKQWHTLKLRFSGSTITGFVDNTQVLTATNTRYSKGMAGLLTQVDVNAQFDNLLINTVNGTIPKPRILPIGLSKIYNASDAAGQPNFK